MRTRCAWKRAASALVASALCSCISGAITTTTLPESREGPIPARFQGSEPPVLDATDVPGLMKASGLGPNVYYHDPADLWYRRAYRRWYQAFRWDGNWFILSGTPAVLVGREIEKVELPDLEDLPPLPDVEDVDDLPDLPEDEEPEGFEPP
ncbi:MAG: hypothetical protein JRG82_09980 [Deltaproteobacteria bacterium]|nr:hypothetical protein [Deltaproteobacteria bacterium]